MRSDQRRYLKLTPLGAALGALLGEASPLGVRLVRVGDALGRVCAKAYTARWDVPRADVSAMDGYAVRSADLPRDGSERLFRVVGEATSSGVGRGEACYVSTGSPLPRGADTVVRVEETRYLGGGRVSIGVWHPPGKNVSQRGEDLNKGQTIVGGGEVLSPAALSLLVYFGYRRVAVYEKPRVGVLSVGDELVDYAGGGALGGRPDRHHNYNNNAWLIMWYLRRLGFEPEYFGVAGDDEEAVRARVARALRSVDVLVTLGGASVGVRDTTPDAVGSLPGSHILFHGLRAVPIKPVGAAVLGWGGLKRFVVLLPGHIVSAALGFHVVCAPLLAKLGGASPTAYTAGVCAVLGSKLENKRNLEALYLVRLRREGLELVAEPLGWGSNLMGHVLVGGGYVRVGAGVSLEAGVRVWVELLDPFALMGLG